MNKSILKNLARKLKKLRKVKGLKLRDVSEVTSLTQSHLSMIENAKTTPSLQTLISLADFYHVDLAALFASVEPKRIVHFGQNANQTLSADATHSLCLIAGPHLPDQQKVMHASIEKGGRVTLSFPTSGTVFILLLDGSVAVDFATGTKNIVAMESLLFENDGSVTLRSDKDRSHCIIIQYG